MDVLSVVSGISYTKTKDDGKEQHPRQTEQCNTRTINNFSVFYSVIFHISEYRIWVHMEFVNINSLGLGKR